MHARQARWWRTVVLDIISGFWPVVIDLATCNWHKLDTDDVKVILEK